MLGLMEPKMHYVTFTNINILPENNSQDLLDNFVDHEVFNTIKLFISTRLFLFISTSQNFSPFENINSPPKLNILQGSRVPNLQLTE